MLEAFTDARRGRRYRRATKAASRRRASGAAALILTLMGVVPTWAESPSARAEPGVASTTSVPGRLDPGADARPGSEPDALGPAERQLRHARIVRAFNFEEQETNPDPVPLAWFRAFTEPGPRGPAAFPRWNRAEFTFAAAHSGAAAVRLPTQGGSTRLRLSAGAVPIFPESQYTVSAWVRTDGLKAARAAVSARLLDERQRPIAGTERRSPLVRSESEWTRVSIDLAQPRSGAVGAYLQIDLELLQPRAQDESSLLGVHRVWEEDTQGAALFDDVEVAQPPRVTLRPEGDASVITLPEPLTLRGAVRDVMEAELAARLTLRDHAGVLIAQERRPIAHGADTLTWTPHLPRAGWYSASLEILAPAGVLAEAHTAIIALPPRDGPGRSMPLSALRRDFGARVLGSPGAALPGAARTLRTAGIPLATFPAAPADADGAAGLVEAAESLLDAGGGVGLALQRIPAPTARLFLIDTIDPLLLAAHPADAWLPGFRAALERFGIRAPLWELGDPPAVALWSPADTGAKLAAVRTALQSVAPTVRIALPWRIDVPWTPLPRGGGASAVDAVALQIPAALPIDAIAPALRTWLARAGDEGFALSVAIEPQADHEGARASPARGAGADPELDRLMQQAVTAWSELHRPEAAPAPRADAAAGAPPAAPTAPVGAAPGAATLGAAPIMLQMPFALDADAEAAYGRAPAPAPVCALAVWATLSRHLSGLTAVAQLDALPGTRGVIAAAPPSSETGSRSTGVIIAWAESAEPGAVLAGYFTAPGEALTALDPFGNARVITPADSTGRYEIALTATPLILTGVDTALARFSAGFEIAPPFIPAVAAVHDREIVLTNPWPVRITGDIHLTPYQDGPARPVWRFTPSTPMAFSIAPGATMRLPFSLSLSAGEESGTRTLTATVRLTADRAYAPMRLRAPITIGLEDLILEARAQRAASRIEGASGDVTIFGTITNRGTAPRSGQLELIAPGIARQKLPVSNLEPGETVSRRFVIKDPTGALAGRRIRIALIDTEGLERLNKTTTAP